MEHNFSLNNGKVMPSVGLGCGAIKEDEIEHTIRTALAAGYRLFDCALLYGNEAWIGEAFQKIFNEGEYLRENVFISTKLPMIGNRPERVETFLKKSLENLRTSYVDMYLIHFPVGFRHESDDNYFPKNEGVIQLDYEYSDLEALWKAMEDQVIAGRSKAIGLSNFSIRQIKSILKNAHITPANVQVEVHCYFQQKELRKFCKNNGIQISAYAPLGSPGRREAFKPKGVPEVLKDKVVTTIANKYKKTPAQILLKFLVTENVVVLPKSVSKERLEQNIDLFDFEFEKEEILSLRGLDRGEEGRSFDYLKIFDGLEKHPLNPMPVTTSTIETNTEE